MICWGVYVKGEYDAHVAALVCGRLMAAAVKMLLSLGFKCRPTSSVLHVKLDRRVSFGFMSSATMLENSTISWKYVSSMLQRVCNVHLHVCPPCCHTKYLCALVERLSQCCQGTGGGGCPTHAPLGRCNLHMHQEWCAHISLTSCRPCGLPSSHTACPQLPRTHTIAVQA